MSPAKRILLIIALTMMWSPSFLFIKLAVAELPPFTIVTLRVSIAALVLACILLYLRRALPKDPMFWVHSAILAFFSSVMPFILFCHAEQTIESALAAILNGSSPMFTALLAHIFIPTDRLHAQKVIGIGLSAAGMMLLFAPNIQDGLDGTVVGMIAGATAAFCYAIGHIYAKKYQTGFIPFVVPTAQLICSGLMMAPLALMFDDPFSLPMPSASAILGICGLSFFGTILAFIIYYKLIENCGPTAVSMVACFFPVGGMLLGFIFLGETLTWSGLTASFIIFLGLLVVNEAVDLKPLLARFRKADEVV